MALETLKGVKEIGGFKVWQEEPGVRDMLTVDEHVAIDHSQNIIIFQIQNGPIKENGVNGCQVDTLIYAAMRIIDELNNKYPNDYNAECLSHLDLALEALEKGAID